jgi:glutamate/tyrosine decarboxylase-like PLP-dependent enzyme
MYDIKSFMIGPKAENLDLFRQLVLEALDDHLYWRRNHHPEDSAVLSNAEKHTDGFQDFEDRLRDLLFRFLGRAKAGVPFFSPRYIGHMNTDLTIPSLVGYFGAMLYNQNNVAGESSPVTVELEAEVMVMLADMMGFPTSGSGAQRVAAGYLTSGGTAANVYGLWVARNMRTWPLALRLAVARNSELPEVAAVLASLEIDLGPGRGTRSLDQLSYWELANLPFSALYRIRHDAFSSLPESTSAAGETLSGRRQVEVFLSAFTLQSLGERKFFAALGEVFPKEREIVDRPWSVVVGANKHYSWPKATDLLGLGQDGLVEVPITGDFVMDPDALRTLLAGCLRDRQPVLAVVSLFGSTEEGTLDDLDAIEHVRSDLDARGLATWHHVDACYGGYLGALVRPLEGSPVASAEALGRFVMTVATDLGASPGEAEELTKWSESESGWLSWEGLLSRISALGRADSISVDPHKLGYVPYPAGAVLFKDHHSWETVSFDAPYLWKSTTAKLESMFVGRYTLEGSRAGAAAACCWLAHKAIPLSQAGHGKLLAASMLGARRLLKALKSASTGDIRIQPLLNPMTNMLCYIPIPSGCRSLEELDALVRAVAEDFSPTKPSSFMVVKTEVHARRADADRLLGDSVLGAHPGDAHGRVRLPVLRSVVMSPFALTATRGDDGRHLFDVFAEELVQSAQKHAWLVARDRFMEGHQPGLRILVVEDDPEERKALLSHLSVILDRPPESLAAVVWEAESVEEACDFVADSRFPLRRAFLDISLGTRKLGGYEVYRRICERNNEVADGTGRVESVIFLTHGDQDWLREVRAIERDFRRDSLPSRQIIVKPQALTSDPEGRRVLQDALLRVTPRGLVVQ